LNGYKQPRLQVIGNIDLARFAYRAVVFESLTTDFAWEPERWAARDVRLVHRTGEVTGDVMQLPENFRSRLLSTMNANILAPLLPGDPALWFPKKIRTARRQPGRRSRESDARVI
jgi:hypothetical protein